MNVLGGVPKGGNLSEVMEGLRAKEVSFLYHDKEAVAKEKELGVDSEIKDDRPIKSRRLSVDREAVETKDGKPQSDTEGEIIRMQRTVEFGGEYPGLLITHFNPDGSIRIPKPEDKDSYSWPSTTNISND